MLQEKESNVRSAPIPWAAAKDAQRRNDENRSTYSAKQRAKAQSIYDILHSTYDFKRMYMNYRKTMITIKIEEAHVKDSEARDLDLYLASEGIQKVRTDQGVVFRIPRQ